MHFLSIILFGVSANIDNFTVGIAYGINKIKIRLTSNILIALITGTGTFISMSIGLLISKFLPVRFTNIFGAIILITIGLWFIITFFINKNKSVLSNILDNPEKTDIDKSGTIDIKESITLAFALTVNNFGIGIGASITGLNPILTILCTMFFSILSIILGTFIGNSYLSKVFGKYSSLVSGMIIFLLGLYEIFI